jgi:oligopeptide transport system ATP-binding protein
VSSSAVTALLEARGLGVDLGGRHILDEASFEIRPGEALGLVGESGSGKSTLARASLGLIPASRGTIRWCGIDIRRLSSESRRARRRDFQMVSQDPLASLDPRMSVAQILAEPLLVFEPRKGAAERESDAAAMLERVGLSAAAMRRHPHELSGGQCQRIGIARAMMPRPKLLVCDEPVSSLDVSVQGQVVNLLADLQSDLGTALLFISHNLAVVRQLAQRVMVMEAGRIVEMAERDTLFSSPAHPYTRALLAAVPDRVSLNDAESSE